LYAEKISFPLDTKDEKIKSSLVEVMFKADNVALILGDGDFSDTSYDTVKDIINEVNSKTENRCALLYLGWSLYNSECDHQKLSEKFDFSLNEASNEQKEAIKFVVGKENAEAPTLAIIRRGTGLCTINGKCEDKDTPILVAVDCFFKNAIRSGSDFFPWNEEAIKSFEEAKRLEIETITSNLMNMKFLTEPEEANNPVVVQKGGTAPLKERIFVGDEDGVIGLYFSAHWCPPCQCFTPNLIECYEKIRKAGKKFEVVFVSSDSSKAEFESYYESMRTSVGDQFLALDYEKRELRNNLSEAFEVEGIPTLILLRPDGTVISKDGYSAVMNSGADAFPWDTGSVERVFSERIEAALKKEKDDEESQHALGTVIVKRLAGRPENVNHDIDANIFTFKRYSTIGCPGLFSESGIIYYELEISKDGTTQFGFALKDGIERTNEIIHEGVGDDALSWGVDGFRSLKWHGGSDGKAWEGKWKVGDVIGLAANIEKGMMAVSKNGDWETGGFGLVFRNDSIKKGVYPCITGDAQIRYGFQQDSFEYGPPPESVWNY